MDLNRFTEKSQEALQQAQAIAVRHGHTEVDGEHLLLALLEQERGLVPRLFQKMDVPLEPLRKRLEGEIERRPRVSGPGAKPGKVHITQRLQRLIDLRGRLDGVPNFQPRMVHRLVLKRWHERTPSDESV